MHYFRGIRAISCHNLHDAIQTEMNQQVKEGLKKLKDLMNASWENKI